ncbi:prephenate dehydratase [Promicromonospora sukumoe]|uniref:prephenate dehydratase n=1 Tax=Promicromonospora sukumoe TaxID=88382 RepID=UPI0003A96ED4|nr:prephenate dehydratase domain-containing protein [Promicromonospora sukumoe]
MTAPGGTRVAYLGPEGTFTHQAALQWARGHAASGTGDDDAAVTAEPLDTVRDVHDAVATGRADVGVVAIESSVEGYVVPSLDTLLSSADVVAVDEVALDVSFDAFVRPDHGELTEVSAHPHGLAQCSAFVTGTGLGTAPASSNAAACRDAGPGTIALGPTICGELYGLDTYATAVEDFRGGRTRFLVLTRRSAAAAHLARSRAAGETDWKTMLAITPSVTGPGVLARITTAFGDRGVNMSSLITRPLKAQESKYVFVVTFDEAPWAPGARDVLGDLLAAGDALKTLGLFPAGAGFRALDGVLDPDHVPVGSVSAQDEAPARDQGLLW